MEYLLSTEIEMFMERLKDRMKTEQNNAFYPLVGALHWYGVFCFGSVYVDNRNPALVTKVIVKSKKILPEDIVARGDAEDDSVIGKKWEKTADTMSLVYQDYVLFMWFDMKGEVDLAAVKSLINDSDRFRIKSSDCEVVEMFRSTFPQFPPRNVVHAYISILHSSPVHFPCPEGYRLTKLSLDDTNTAMKSYKFASEIKNNLALCALNGLGVGAYHIESNQLVACVFVNWDGSISGLQTFAGHRRKGLAKAVVSRLAGMLKERSAPVFCFIERDIERDARDANLSLYKQLGFQTYFDTTMTWA